MLIGVLFSGVLGSFLGFLAAILSGQPLPLAFLTYSLSGIISAMTFILATRTTYRI